MHNNAVMYATVSCNRASVTAPPLRPCIADIKFPSYRKRDVGSHISVEKNLNHLKLMVMIVAISTATISCSTVDEQNSNRVENAHLRSSTLHSMSEIMDEFGLPSLSVAVLVDGKVIFSEALGYADIELKIPATSETQYSVGSIAKPMTTIALGRLIDSEVISVNSEVGDFVSLPTTYHHIKIGQLASHTGGVPHSTPERERYEFIDVQDHESPFEVLDTFVGHPLLFEPGTGFEYSSNGYILLSAVIEASSKQGYVEFLRKSVWAKLDMTSTELDNSLAGLDSEATYYSSRGDSGEFVQATNKRDRSFLFGGGGFISTPTDLVKMSRALFTQGYLSEEVKRELLTPFKLKNGDDNPQFYALGWRIGKIDEGKVRSNYTVTAHHGGVTDGAATAYLYVIPDRNAAIAFATNILPDRFWEMRPKIEKILVEHLD